MADLGGHVLQWFMLLLRHQIELHDEVVEVLVAGVDMSLLWGKKRRRVVVCVIDMGRHFYTS